jgi:hypothetical protein
MEEWSTGVVVFRIWNMSKVIVFHYSNTPTLQYSYGTKYFFGDDVVI